ncbi:uncharacterized protein TNCV_351951 [Trichonephila clavipes]|nr:uncharacterized protein TNCV_351951 [Trichonephila clavipes]
MKVFIGFLYLRSTATVNTREQQGKYGTVEARVDRRTASHLVRLVEGEERWEACEHQGVYPQNCEETELNCSVTCIVLKATVNDRRHVAFCHDEFRGSRSGYQVTNSWVECYELETSVAEETPLRGGRCTLKQSILEQPPVGVVWKLGERVPVQVSPSSLGSAQGLLATDHVILNRGQVTWTTPELALPSPNYHTTPIEDVSALDRVGSLRDVFDHVLFLSLDHGSKLRGPPPKTLQ